MTKYVERKRALLRPTLRGFFVALLSMASIAAVSEEGQAEASDEGAASLSGVIRYSARVSRAGFDGLEAPSLAEDPAARGLRYALIYLEREDADSSEGAAAGSSLRSALPPAKMDQVNFRFQPQIMVVRPGQRVIFGNGDYQNHNIRTSAKNPRNSFNIITVPGKTYEKRFQLEDRRAPLPLACDFHSSMQAWIYILDHARYAVTDAAGRFRMPPLVPGTYRLHIHHPESRLRAETTVMLGPGDHFVAETTFGLGHRYYRDMPDVRVRVEDR